MKDELEGMNIVIKGNISQDQGKRLMGAAALLAGAVAATLKQYKLPIDARIKLTQNHNRVIDALNDIDSAPEDFRIKEPLGEVDRTLAKQMSDAEETK